MSGNTSYWAFSIVAGSMCNVFLFLSMPMLEKSRTPPPVPVIKVNFMEWREPVHQKPKQKKADHPKLKPVRNVKKTTPVEQPNKVKHKQVSTIKRSKIRAEDDSKPQIPEPVSKFEEKALEPVPHFKLSTVPRFVHLQRPLYPSIMRRAGKEGTVKLEVLIDAKGAVRKITVVQSAGKQFDEAAVTAMKGSTFIPGAIEGRAVTTLLKLPVTFKLR